MGDEELRVMVTSGHGCHVAAFVGGPWNDDFPHHFIVGGIGYNLSFAPHLYSMKTVSTQRVDMIFLVVCMYDEHSLSTLWDFRRSGAMVTRTCFSVVPPRLLSLGSRRKLTAGNVV